jgi:acyl-CoA synthetase (NDP forming)
LSTVRAPGLLEPERLHRFFNPESVALIGATDRSRWSISTYANWRDFSDGRPVYLVHPTHETVHGERVYPSLSAIPSAVDLAYVMVPTDQVLPVLEEAARLGIRNAVILTSGFAEMGPEGQALQDRLVELAVENDMVLLGPNGNGFINASGHRAPYGLPISPPLVAGPVGIVLQSGGLASSVLAMAQGRGIGVSHVVSMGNEAMITATDVLAYLVAHDETRCIAVFLESIRHPEDFRAVANAALEVSKPIVVMKVGRTAAGQEAALAHTGAVVGDAAVIEAALDELGVVQVRSLEDLLTTAGFLGYQKRRIGRRLGVVAASGGACDIIADRATDEGIELPNFPEPTLEALRDFLPPYSNPHNPLDVTGYVVVDASLSQRALEIVVEGSAETFDAVLFQSAVPRVAPPDVEPLMARYARLAEIMETAPVPVILQSGSTGEMTGFATTVIERFGFHFLSGIEHGMTALGRALWWQEQHDRLRVAPKPEAADPVARPADARGAWGEARSRALLAAHGVPVVPTKVAGSPAAAATAASELGWPVALKIASDQLLHKSDIGGVALGLRTPEEVADAAERLLKLAEEHQVAAEGVQVAPMRTGGVELLVSVKRDRLWGPVLAVGLGGVWVEVLADTALRLLPTVPQQIDAMLGELRGARLLEGVRGQPPVDRAALIEAIQAVARLGEGLGEALDTLEINPMWASPNGTEALDALIIWAEEA